MDIITHEMRLVQWVPIVREYRHSGMAAKAGYLENNIKKVVLLLIASRSKSSFLPDMIIHMENIVLEISFILLFPSSRCVIFTI